MGKCVAYVAAAVVFMGLGALIAGACVWFLAPNERATFIQEIQEIRHAECVLRSSVDVTGIVRFQQFGSGKNNPMTITGNISGLATGLHGFHIHQWGVPADGDCTGCGGHYNPKGFNHGAPGDAERHAGDFGNINATEDVPTIFEMTDLIATLWGDESAVGRAIVIHAGEDDLGKVNNTESMKTGNAGSRVACCTITLVKA